MSTPVSKTRFEALIATAVDGIMVIDSRGALQEYSPACERLFGYASAEVIGQNVKMLMPTPYHEHHDEYLSHYKKTHEKRIIGIGREVIGRRKDGTTFPMYLSVGEGRMGDESIFVGVVHDMSEQQSSERKLRTLQTELLHVSRLSEIGHMASALAHELNQPLTAIANYTRAAQVILEDSNAPEMIAVRNAMNSVAEQAARAGQIIRRIRDFVARGDTEKTVEKVGAIVDETIKLAAAANKLSRVKVKLEIKPTIPKVVADKIQIQQVLLNLIRNATEALEGHASPELIVSASPQENGGVEISVRDNGPGLAPEIVPRLFEPFVSTKKDGMGVGLSICRTIIESHGGRLKAVANAEGGTTFSFTLTQASSDG